MTVREAKVTSKGQVTLPVELRTGTAMAVHAIRVVFAAVCWRLHIQSASGRSATFVTY